MPRSLIAAVISLTACATPAGDERPEPSDPIDIVDPGEPVGPTTYALRTDLTVPLEAVLPAPAYDVTQELREFTTHPGATLLELAGVPDVFPSVVEVKLAGWLDDQIPAPVIELAAMLVSLAELELTHVSFDSELVVDGGVARHRVLGLELATTAAREGGTLAIGDHAIGIDIGARAWRELTGVVEDTYGATPRALLGTAVNCPAVAAAVARRCVLGVCVGHQAELAALCERGLDELVAAAQSRVESIRFDLLRFAHGTASVDGETLRDGVWTCELDAGQGLRPVPATFQTTSH